MAIVHHWCVSQGGAERVLDVLVEMFPEADIFTLVADEKFYTPAMKGRKVITSFLQSIPGATRFHRYLLPLYPLAVEQLDLTDYDVVLSSDSGPIKGIITRPHAVHVCYCHSPMRYLWDEYHAYQKTMPKLARIPFAIASHYVRGWDCAAAQRVTHFIANSDYIASRISRFYGRTSTVLHPPVDTTRGFIQDGPKDYYLAVGRMVAYKHTGILIEACNRLKAPLKVVGIGPEMKRLRKLAGPTIEFVGAVSDDELWNIYANARALLFGAQEDFGIVPLESQACGRPVIAFGKGGSLETIRANHPGQREKLETSQTTGLFFFQQTPEAVMDAIQRFEQMEMQFSPQTIQRHAREFDTAYFRDRLRKVLVPWFGEFAESLEMAAPVTEKQTESSYSNR